VEVPCGGAVHRVLLRRGRIVLVDHVVDAELAVAALGGSPPPCVDVLRSWRSREAWERALEPRGPGFHQLYRRPPLPRALTPALELGVARGWERRAARGDREAARLLDAAIRSRGEGAARAALASAMVAAGCDRARVERCEVVRTELPRPSVLGRIDEHDAALTIRVTADWYRTVGYGRRALTEDGTFVVRRDRSQVTVLTWQRRGPGSVVAVLEARPA